jgi:serine/threonine protein kinase
VQARKTARGLENEGMPLDTSKPTQQIGNYDLLAKLAEGGMGTVYKARSRITGDIVAIKIVPSTTAKNPVLLRRFEQEFRAASALDHPNIVRAIEYCGVGPTPFLVMEFVDGESLGQRIERDGPIPEEESIRLMAQVCQGLNKAHKLGLIHRDVKPDNIMVNREGIAKLTDLGLVKDVEGELNLTRTGRGLGTPHFMAPEQFRNAKNVDVRCDIYSLGATLYMMVTGHVPFGKVGPLDCWMKKVRNDFIPPRELNPRVSERVDWAIRRSMSADPEKRPASCREFIEDLHGKQIRPPSVSSAEGLAAANPADVWYLVYKDENHETHTVKGTTEGIRRALKDGLLGDTSGIRACRTKSGPFQTLDSFPEFRDLVVAPAPLPTPGQQQTNTPMPTKQTTPPPSSEPSWKGLPAVTPPRPRDPDAVEIMPRAQQSGPVPGLTNPPGAPKESRPHIPIPRPASQRVQPSAGSDWWVWLVVLAVALATAFAAVFLLPKLTS